MKKLNTMFSDLVIVNVEVLTGTIGNDEVKYRRVYLESPTHPDLLAMVIDIPIAEDLRDGDYDLESVY